MEILYSQPSHTRNDDIDVYENILLSDHIDLETLGDVRFRLTIDRVWAGAEVIVSWQFTTGGVPTAASNITWVEEGNFELSINHSAFDDTTLLDATVQTVGRVRFGFVVVSAAQGEDVPEWL